jgi:ketosteroid isomerase-like protein
MSEENVAIVLAAFQRFDESRRPDPGLWHEDGFLTAPDGWPEPGPFKGREAVMRQFERLIDDYSASYSTDVEVIAQKDDWVVVAFRWHTRGAKSGIASTWEMAVAFRLKDERFIEGHYRWERQEALEAAGLSE